MTDEQSKKENSSRRDFLKGAGAAGGTINPPRTARADTGKMKAGVYYGRHDMRFEMIPRPDLNREGLIVKVGACGICHILDKQAWENSGNGHAGIARGHEWSGEIVEVGPDHTDFKVGDRIYMEPSYEPCYRCAACKVRDYWRCLNPLEGEVGTRKHGAFAEYVHIPFATNESAILLPKTLSFRDLALIEVLALGVGAARRVRTEEVVAVIGQDILGLGTVAALKRRGVPKVIASDISKIRRKASEEAAGADIIIDSLKDDVVKAVMDETRGLGVDAVIQCDARPTTIFQALNMVKDGGQIWTTSMMGGLMQLNVQIPDATMTPKPMEASILSDSPVSFGAGATIHSAFSYGSRLSRFQETVELLQSGRCTADKVVTHVFPLEKIREAFEIAMDPHESIRVMIEP